MVLKYTQMGPIPFYILILTSILLQVYKIFGKLSFYYHRIILYLEILEKYFALLIFLDFRKVWTPLWHYSIEAVCCVGFLIT